MGDLDIGMARQTRLKGVNFHGTLGALERRFGKDAVQRVKTRMKGEGGQELRNGAIVSGGWYPASHYDALLVAIEEEYPTTRGIVAELCRDAVTQDFQTLFRVVSLVATPEWAMSGASRVMTRYIENTRVAVKESREGHVHFRFDDFYGYTPRMWEDFIAGLEAVMDLMRVRRLPTKIVAGGGDEPHLEVIIRYTRS